MHFMPEMASSPEIAPVSSPPLNYTSEVIDEKLSSPPAASPVPTPPASPPPAPPPALPVSPSVAPPPINSPLVSPPPYSPPPSSPSPPSNSPPPDSSPPLLPPPIASPPPPTSLPLSPPTQSQSPPPPELSPPPPSPSPPANPDNPPSSLPPIAASPPSLSAATSTSLAQANNSIQIPVFSPSPPGAIPNVQPPPDVVEKYSPPSQPILSLITPMVRSVPSPPASARSLSPPPSSSGSTTGIIIGVAVVAGFLGVVAVICIVLLKRKKRQPYYIDPGHPPAGGEPHYNNWNSPMAKIPPTQPGVMGVWGATPSPSPGVMATPPVGWQPTPLNTSNEYISNSAQQQQQRHYGPLSPGGGAVGGGAIGGFSKFQFTYEELATATGRFSKVNLLGQGGFGYVHKGVLPDGKQVAVKSLKDGSGQGEREFQAEVEIISRVHHRHLVSLVGYCMGGNERMLVYEFVPNKTLEFHLHGKGQPVMDWATRLKIALGAAKGLAYLHEDCHPRIIHRDIKAANILLDDNNEAMVADFGLAKLTSDNLSHISTRVMGTFGYLAPEYATTGKLTEKSDVFSFGVMLLEFITGKKPVDPINKFAEDCLVDWARPRITKAIGDVNYDELVDPRLEGKYDIQEMARMISCAAASIQHSARRRPKMSQIVRALDGDPSVDLNSDPDGTRSETDTYNTEMHNADMMKLNKMVMPSNNDFTSSEYGATNEYSNEFLHDQSQQHNNVTRS